MWKSCFVQLRSSAHPSTPRLTKAGVLPPPFFFHSLSAPAQILLAWAARKSRLAASRADEYRIVYYSSRVLLRRYSTPTTP
eukprot:scaffold144941_cov23-Tisochrysis_lutea.AAC.1